MIRKMLVPVRGDGKGDNVLAHAAALAKRFNAHVMVTHCRPRAQDMLPYGVPIPSFLKKQLDEQAGVLADQVAGKLHADFDALAESFNLTVSDTPQKGKATAAWVEESGRQVEIIKRHGRLADLVLVPQPEANGVLGVNSLKAALFHTGRPAMICPNTGKMPTVLGDHIVIAWNGSTEAARAVALSLGLLEDAADVTVLTGGEEAHGTSADDLADYLSLRGIASKTERFKAAGNVGQQLLDRAEAAGADMMIMGAYGDNYQKEVAFGGNTQTVVDHTKIPIIMAH
ncbi:universal stress protein [Ahrensia sp. R2A130]|uniref:universal stress protein n=1 Tax=Ahrensia sp. R2A130 TaxID=744979 RepID=UPI0001E0D8BB|nr:universal stress protein [Ahrensia sp. R2A130]EFL87521.1 UspA domain-containing protein [Ahrensia sp. R2A130]